MKEISKIRLVHNSEINGSVAPFQSGFIDAHSTIDNILDLETQIKSAVLRRNHLIPIFFILERSYDLNLYVDDANISCRCKDLPIIENQLQTAVIHLINGR